MSGGCCSFCRCCRCSLGRPGLGGGGDDAAGGASRCCWTLCDVIRMIGRSWMSWGVGCRRRWVVAVVAVAAVAAVAVFIVFCFCR